MARPCRIKKNSDANYHLMSRTNDKRFLFREGEENENAVSGDWCLRRVVQIGAGKVFGGEHFVISTAFALGDRFKAGSVGAHRVDELGWSTHGWRLAAGKRRKIGRNERVGA